MKIRTNSLIIVVDNIYINPGQARARTRAIDFPNRIGFIALTEDGLFDI